MNQPGRQITEWNQHKPAPMITGMRKNQSAGLHRAMTEDQQVQVDHPRTPFDASSPTHHSFHLQKAHEQGAGEHRRANFEDGEASDRLFDISPSMLQV
jgi:hypothetical protein